MFENDSIQAFHQKQPRKPQKMQSTGMPPTAKRDEFIMDTNSSSIVSKRSVEKLYYPDQPSYLRYFVRKFQRRSPLINRGYWLRMKAVERTVSRFLEEPTGKTKVVVNLGCGYDPLPFQYLGNHKDLCSNAVFVDVDYPQLMQRKLQVIEHHEPLRDLLPGLAIKNPPAAVLGDAEQYKAIGCDLKDVRKLDRILKDLFDLESCSIALLFVAEVSVAYMEKEAANAVLSWAASLKDGKLTNPTARFCLLEQHLPDGADHPFAQTMLKHFEKLRTPLHAIGTLDQMRERFVQAGWAVEQVRIKSLWEVWCDSSYVTADERRALDKVEPFDEWEEFALFAAHYFLLVADSNSDHNAGEPSITWTSGGGRKRPMTSVGYQRIEKSESQRRFGAIAPSRVTKSLCHYGGVGSRERQKSGDFYAHDQQPVVRPIDLPAEIPSSLMCHTITPFGQSQLLVGGRTSPDKASNACWLLDNGQWKETHSLVVGRFRHCAVQVNLPVGHWDWGIYHEEPSTGVLVFGGKTSSGDLLKDWLLYRPNSGWETMEAEGAEVMEPRFGAAMCVESSSYEKDVGYIFGGMRDDGTVIVDSWKWTLTRDDDQKLRLHVEPGDPQHGAHVLPEHLTIGRFGSQAVFTDHGCLIIIGGITAKAVVGREAEIVDNGRRECIPINGEYRPFLIGISTHAVEEGIMVAGGGATCFSFGTCWNQSGMLTRRDRPPDQHLPWQIMNMDKTQATSSQHLASPATRLPADAGSGSTSDIGGPDPEIVPHMQLSESQRFEEVLSAGRPIVLSDLDLGDCVQKWTTAYLKESVGSERPVVVHDSPGPHMNFQTKNFNYNKTKFGDFIDAVEQGSSVYLRALSAEKPAEAVTDLEIDFPSLAKDFALPAELSYVKEHAHSSPLRISGAVTMWLHYDVMANVLCQIKGRKRVLLYPPEEVTHLGIPAGASSSVLNPFEESTDESSSLRRARAYEATLEEGQVLFIPPLWSHAAQPLSGLSIAVNVFFRDERMEAAYAAGKDIYGNRDIAAYERGRRDVQRIAKSVDGLPLPVRKFYLGRLAQELRAISQQ